MSYVFRLSVVNLWNNSGTVARVVEVTHPVCCVVNSQQVKKTSTTLSLASSLNCAPRCAKPLRSVFVPFRLASQMPWEECSQNPSMDRTLFFGFHDFGYVNHAHSGISFQHLECYRCLNESVQSEKRVHGDSAGVDVRINP